MLLICLKNSVNSVAPHYYTVSLLRFGLVEREAEGKRVSAAHGEPSEI